MTLFYIWIAVAVITLVALKHEIEQLRKLMRVRQPWTMSAVVLMTAFSIVTPLGLLYLWIIIKHTEGVRQRMRSAQHEWM